MTVSKQKSNTIPVLIVLLGIVAGYYLGSGGVFDLFKLSPEPVPEAVKDDLSKFKNLRSNFSILDDSRYRGLELFGEYPVNAGAPGKPDLFAPI